MKSVEEVQKEIMQLGILKQGDRIPQLLKDWADSIIDTCVDVVEGHMNSEGIEDERLVNLITDIKVEYNE